MPTYHYRCQTCKHEFEEFQSMSEEPIKVCPSCGGETHRIISGGTGFIFKGSGFYITDYKRKDTGDSGKESTSLSSDKPTTPPPPSPRPSPPSNPSKDTKS